MPDQTVKVTFTPPAAWTFDPNPVHMTAAGKVILHRDPGSAAWVFVRATGLPAGFTWSIQGNGSQLVIQDPYGPPYNQPFAYGVTVSLNGTEYSSPMRIAGAAAAVGKMMAAAGPPPIITNDGSTTSQS